MQKDILAVIGGMGSGKSTVLHLLREQFHYETIEMDRLAKDCYQDRAFLSALRAFLPKKVFQENGDLAFDTFRSLLLSNCTYRKKVETLVHPMVYRKTEERIHLARQEGGKLAVETALPNQAFLSLADAVLFVEAPMPIRIARLVDKRGYTEREAREMIEAQHIEEYRDCADFVLQNAGDVERVKDALCQFIQRI